MNCPRLIHIVLVLAAIFVLGLLAIAIFRAREPRYQGRTLTEWIKVGDDAHDKYIINHHGNPSGFETTPDCRTARDAILRMAPESFNWLLRWVEAKDSQPKKKVIRWLLDHPSVPIRVKRDNYYHTLAYLGFRLLGSDAKPAQSALI